MTPRAIIEAVAEHYQIPARSIRGPRKYKMDMESDE